uniref:Arrestin-like N-terminal domain-containing protein n=1 Tax=Panagrolaimus davidi TaxID=227884 RepID=A0A914QHX6_9BILA
MKNLSFELYNNPERCYPGSAMAGQLILETTKPINCSKITIEPNGLSKVFFYRSIGHGRSRGYSNQEKYFSGSIILYEPVDNPSAILPPGKYSYPFRFLFPNNCVPTFNDPKGKATVKYELIAKVHIRRGRNLTKKQPLTVCPILDFNTDLDLCRPVQLLSQNSELQVTVSFF